MADMKTLEPLLGRWQVQVRFPAGAPYGELTGELTCEWMLGGPYLSMSQSMEGVVPSSFSVVEADASGDGFTQHYYDTRGVTRLLAMTWEGGTWTLSRDKADFSPLPFRQRYSGQMSDDGRTIEGAWHRTGDGEWLKDFDLTHTRVG